MNNLKVKQIDVWKLEDLCKNLELFINRPDIVYLSHDTVYDIINKKYVLTVVHKVV